MMGCKICFHEEIWIIIPKLTLLLLLIWSTGCLFQSNPKDLDLSYKSDLDLLRLFWQGTKPIL